MKNAVIYARYSSYNQTEMSIEGQVAECRSYAEKNGLFIVPAGLTGTTLAPTRLKNAIRRM